MKPQKYINHTKERTQQQRNTDGNNNTHTKNPINSNITSKKHNKNSKNVQTKNQKKTSKTTKPNKEPTKA